MLRAVSQMSARPAFGSMFDAMVKALGRPTQFRRLMIERVLKSARSNSSGATLRLQPIERGHQSLGTYAPRLKRRIGPGGVGECLKGCPSSLVRHH